MDKCIKRICGWTGTDDEKKAVINQKQSKELGVTIKDLVCPKCGCNTFTEVPEKPTKQIGSLKKQRGYYGFGDAMGTAFMVMLIIAGFIGWAGIELIIWLFSHIDISWK